MSDREALRAAIRAFDQLHSATCGTASQESIIRQFGKSHAAAIRSSKETIDSLRAKAGEA